MVRKGEVIHDVMITTKVDRIVPRFDSTKVELYQDSLKNYRILVRVQSY